MNNEQKKRLEARGWKFGTAAEFLGLTPEEEAEVEAWVALEMARRALARLVVDSRGKRLTQTDIANRIGSKQPRIARIEAADKSVSLDLMIKAALAAGANLHQIGVAIAQAETNP